jgi:cytochrome c553
LDELASLPPPSLAAFVRDAEITEDYPRSFNMYELIQDAIRIDDVFPAYRAYLYALGNTVRRPGMRGAEGQRAVVGAHFDEVFLGRSLDCMTCHNSKNAVTLHKGRHHPLHPGLDPPVFDHLGGFIPAIDPNAAPYLDDCLSCHGSDGQGKNGTSPTPSILGKDAAAIQAALDAAKEAEIANIPNAPIRQMAYLQDLEESEIEAIAEALRDPGPFSTENLPETARKHFAFWRRDFFSADDPDQGFGPWNISTSCASITKGSATEGPIDAFFGGFTSSYGTVKDLDDKLRAGRAALPGATSIDGDTAFAYMVAAKITENVWLELMGSPLTVVNYYARNEQQKDLHRYLTESVFLEHGWSLRELIVAILSLDYFNRRAPAASLQDQFDELPPIFDAFVPESRTCVPEPERDPSGNVTVRDESPPYRTDPQPGGGDTTQCAYNGQGELLHRYSPRTLLQAASKALAWPAPQSFAADAYPSLEFQKALGQYVSNRDTGRSSVDFQSLLSWDGAFSRCGKSGKGVVGDQDWIDALIAGIQPFNVSNPATPLTLRDVVLTLKDWLIQEPKLREYVPEAGFGGLAKGTSEVTVLQALFGTALSTPVTSASISEDALRELCGVYLKSPQSMLAGVVHNDALDPPRLRVCNAGPCSYLTMCQSFGPALAKVGHSIQCQAGSVSAVPDLVIQSSGGAPDPSGTSSLTLQR